MVDNPDAIWYDQPMERTTRRRSENLIGSKATILRQVNDMQRQADARNAAKDDDWKPFRRPNPPQHPTSRAFERKHLGLDPDDE